MKSKFLILTLFVLAAVTVLITASNGNEDVSTCMVKYKSEWGKPCVSCTEYGKSYRVYFRNECYNKVDVKVAAQENDKRWKSYTKIEVGYADTIVAYACKGTGKYLIWVKKSGDTAVDFPSDDEVSHMP